jgi:uroporphyrinogen decarboxylase
MHEVAQIQLRAAGEKKYFVTGGLKFDVGSKVIVEADRGLEYGEVVKAIEQVPDLNKLEKRLEDHCNKVEDTDMGIICKAQTSAFTAMCAMGYSDFLLNTVMDVDFVYDMINKIHDYCMKELEVFLQYPVDVIQLSSGLVTNSAPMVAPDDLEKLETKYIREEIDLAKAYDKKIHFHIDGKIDSMIPDFAEMGVDILNPIDLCSGNQDIFEIKKAYGDIITISGNIDIEGVLKNGSPEDVTENVIRHIEGLAHGGGYIVSSSHNLHHYVPLENFYAMRDAAHNYKMKVN